MTESLPRPIDPEDIRIGDTVQMHEMSFGGIPLHSDPLLVHECLPGYITFDGGDSDADKRATGRTWTLLAARPEPLLAIADEAEADQ